jgi:hypothetical protein
MKKEELLAQLITEYLDPHTLEKNYPWDISRLLIDGSSVLGLSQQEILDVKNATSAFSQNRLLRSIVRQRLSLNKQDYPLLYWIIKDWGGISAFKSPWESQKNLERIDGFFSCLESGDPLRSELFNIISSLSKLSSFWDPEKYVIYDNRAIYTLNYIIYKANENRAGLKYFPIKGGSRNKMITEKPIEILIGKYNRNNFYAEEVAYYIYCDLIIALNGLLYPEHPDEPYRTEMLLFTKIEIPFREMNGKLDNLKPKLRGKVKKHQIQKIDGLSPKQKYYPIQELLASALSKGMTTVTVTIDELNQKIERIGKGQLPEVAYKYGVFWGNDYASKTHVWKTAWLSQGFVVANTSGVVNPQRLDGDPVPVDGVVTFQFVKADNIADKESSSSRLEKELEIDLETLYRRIQNEIKSNTPKYFSIMLAEKGTLATAREILSSKDATDGFTILLLMGRLDLTLEFLIVNNPKYHPLFSDTMLNNARQRIGRI